MPSSFTRPILEAIRNADLVTFNSAKQRARDGVLRYQGSSHQWFDVPHKHLAFDRYVKAGGPLVYCALADSYRATDDYRLVEEEVRLQKEARHVIATVPPRLITVVDALESNDTRRTESMRVFKHLRDETEAEHVRVEANVDMEEE